MIVIKNLSYDSPAGERLFADVSISFPDKKIGLVGKNGTGKTALLRLIMGEETPTEGKIEYDSDIAYMPQDYQLDLSRSISEVLGIKTKLEAIERIKNGNEDENLIALIDNDWDIENRAFTTLEKMRLKDMDLTRPVGTLSGGERIKVLLASLTIRDADFLIMDEPTNNLDREAKKAVYALIKDWHKGLLIVSHDRELLNLMDEIVELSGSELRTYGGNYEMYSEQKRIEEEALERQLVNAKQELHKNKKEAIAVREQQQKKNSHGKKAVIGQKINKGAINAMISQANATTGKLKIRHEQKVEDAQNKFEDIKSRIPETNKIFIELPDSRVPNGKTVAEFKDVSFSYAPDKILLADINFTVFGPERIALVGKNGSGKTTLVKLLLGEITPLGGEIRMGITRLAYLDQHVAFMDSDKTLLENMKATSGLGDGDGRNYLAKFLFASDTVFKNFSALSGGERIRATLACALAQKETPQLLILDEPTNNLDLDSIERLESALANYRGALIVISHDKTFLENVGIEREIKLG